MKAEHVRAFANAVVETLKAMADLDAEYKKPVLKTHPSLAHDITGSIGLSGKVTGSVSLAFPEASALKIVSRFVGETVDQISEDVTDAVGELINIVAGYAKKDLSELKLSISLPSVVVGKGHTISVPKGAKGIVVPFETSSGSFALEIFLKGE